MVKILGNILCKAKEPWITSCYCGGSFKGGRSPTRLNACGTKLFERAVAFQLITLLIVICCIGGADFGFSLEPDRSLTFQTSFAAPSSEREVAQTRASRPPNSPPDEDFPATSPAIQSPNQPAGCTGLKLPSSPQNLLRSENISAISAQLPPSGSDVSQIAQVGKTWRLADLEALAAVYNPTLALAQARLRSAEGRQIQSRIWPNPTIGYLGDEIGDEDQAGLQGVYVSYNLPNPRERRATQRAADLYVIQQRHLLALQRLRVLGELRRRFYQVVVAEERLRAAQRIGEIAAQISRAIQSRFERGEVARVEVFQAEVLQEQAAIDIERQRQSLEHAWALLAAVVGLPQLERRPLLVEEDLARTAHLDWATWEARIMNENPELLAARSAVEIARAELLAATAQKIPEIELETIIKHHNTNAHNSVSVAVGIPVPVFDTRRGAILSAEASLREAEANLRRVELVLRSRMAETKTGLAQSTLAAERYRSVVLARRAAAVELLREAYVRGEIHLIDLLEAERNLRAAELEYLDNLENIYKLIVDLETLLVGSEAGLAWDR
jgi:cobalt-zinc-cadmium efflux system outer membrane protein